MTTAGHRDAVRRDYDARVGEWRTIYGSGTFHDHTIRRRLELTLQIMDRLGRPAPAPGDGAGAAAPLVLDAGCGAGQLAVAMAQRGFRAVACDLSAAMAAETAALLSSQGHAGRAVQADTARLPFRSGAFQRASALGLIEYTESPPAALAELARSVSEGGHVVVTAPNPVRLAYLADPIGTIMAWRRPPKGGYKRTYFTARRLAQLCEGAGLDVVSIDGHGIGPLTFAGRRLMPEAAAVRLGERLERLMPRRLRAVLGANLIALARKRP